MCRFKFTVIIYEVTVFINKLRGEGEGVLCSPESVLTLSFLQVVVKQSLTGGHNVHCDSPVQLLVLHGRLQTERERNVLFNDALNTFYLQLYGVRHMVKDHSDSEKGNPLPPHRLLLLINSKGSFICTIPQTG